MTNSVAGVGWLMVQLIDNVLHLCGEKIFLCS
jgi:hypothetical protein